jgi:hypothetical protein
MNETEKVYNNLLIASGYFPTFAWLFPIIFFYFKGTTLNKMLQYFFRFSILMFIFNVLVFMFIWSIDNQSIFWKPYLNYWHIENVLFTRIFFHLNCFIFLGLCYFTIIPIKILIQYKYWIITLICIISLIIYFYIDDYRGYGSIGQNLYHIFIITITLMHLNYLFKAKLGSILSQNPFFWISIGLLIPNALTLFFQFTAQNLYETDFMTYCKIYILTNFIEFIGIGLISFGITKIR